MHKLNYQRIIEVALKESEKNADELGTIAIEKIKDIILMYNPKGLTKEDKSWYDNILGLIDFKAGVLMSSKDKNDIKTGVTILEIKSEYILPMIEKYRMVYEMKELASN